MVSLSGLKGRSFSMVLRMWPVGGPPLPPVLRGYIRFSPRAKETVISGLCLFPLWFYKFLWYIQNIYFTAPWQRLGTRLPSPPRVPTGQGASVPVWVAWCTLCPLGTGCPTGEAARSPTAVGLSHQQDRDSASRCGWIEVGRCLQWAGRPTGEATRSLTAIGLTTEASAAR
ncbi:hypothetical protein GWK47_053620 [Chionoecetes opilio]|uniref:Uncharacterized protein n=1 Tax=Chionoecetes opilio TaxID=41210 RepID=A0A8J4Y0G3_CHIOP|nr:hypothetical protein GWK47_053620 [Chionoecetes opilio]